MMFLARIASLTAKPFVTMVADYELVEAAGGRLVKRPKPQWARRTPGGGAAALSTSPEGAIASARCVLHQDSMDRELRAKRDRA